MKKDNILSLIIGFVLCAALFNFCERRGSDVVTKIKTKVVKITDTLKVDGKVVTKYKNVYVRKTDTSIVYVNKKDSSRIEARLYEQPIKGSRSSGLARITTTGELLDFSATIECQDSIIEKVTTKYSNKSNLFISSSFSSNNSINVGVDWNIKGKVLLKGGVGTSLNSVSPYISLGIGIPIF
jgi:hypothetical protein